MSIALCICESPGKLYLFRASMRTATLRTMSPSSTAAGAPNMAPGQVHVDGGGEAARAPRRLRPGMFFGRRIIFFDEGTDPRGSKLRGSKPGGTKPGGTNPGATNLQGLLEVRGGRRESIPPAAPPVNLARDRPGLEERDDDTERDESESESVKYDVSEEALELREDDGGGLGRRTVGRDWRF